jgi:hypothetical protein
MATPLEQLRAGVEAIIRERDAFAQELDALRLEKHLWENDRKALEKQLGLLVLKLANGQHLPLTTDGGGVLPNPWPGDTTKPTNEISPSAMASVAGGRTLYNSGVYTAFHYLAAGAEVVAKAQPFTYRGPNSGQAQPCGVEIDMAMPASDTYGFLLDAVANCIIRGFSFLNAPDQGHGIECTGSGATGLTVEDCYWPRGTGPNVQYLVRTLGSNITLRRLWGDDLNGQQDLIRCGVTNGLLVEACYGKRTNNGNPLMRLQNAVNATVRNCVLLNRTPASSTNNVLTTAFPINDPSVATDILIEDCFIDGRVQLYPGTARVTFRNCLFDCSITQGVAVDVDADATAITMEDCGLINVTTPLGGAGIANVTATGCLTDGATGGFAGWTNTTAAAIRAAVSGASLMATLRTLGVEA